MNLYPLELTERRKKSNSDKREKKLKDKEMSTFAHCKVTVEVTIKKNCSNQMH